MKFLFITVLFSVSVLAFEHDVHKSITMDAGTVLRRCEGKLKSAFPDLNVKLLQKNVSLAAQGSEDEDITETSFRNTNWHFYNPYQNLFDGIIFEYLDRAVEIRSELYRNNLQNENAAYYSGRVLHYIQDVGVPAHVVPIFHGKPYGKLDEFDQYQIPGGLKQRTLDTISCDQLVTKVRYYLSSNYDRLAMNRNLLDDSAAITLKKINSRIGDLPAKWSHFWRAPLQQKYDPSDVPTTLVGTGTQSQRFGRYRDFFGKSATIVEMGVEYKMSKMLYDNFYAEVFQHSVQNTSIFMIINALFDRH